MNAFLASALTARARERREEEGQHQLSRGAAAALGGGRVADGPRLGPGICVDRRTAFGGSFAPNRFERISTMVVAHIRTKQAAFDEAQPPPPAARRWMSERRAAQARGELPVPV